MKIQYFNGGLGNQIFQYIFNRYIELQTGEICYLDDSHFYLNYKEHNGYELDSVFGLAPHLLSRYFSEDVWKYMVGQREKGVGICQQLKDNGMDIFMIAEPDNVLFDGNKIMLPANKFIPSIVETQGNVYYHGYWINKEWLNTFRDVIQKELQFPQIMDEQNKSYLQAIQEEYSVGIHVRRGDFVSLGWVLDEKFYYMAMEQISMAFPEASYFVFSDDITWCRNHTKDLGLVFARHRIIYVEGNNRGKNYIDMYLLSICKAMIIAKSSFGYLSALLNTQPNRLVINPYFEQDA